MCIKSGSLYADWLMFGKNPAHTGFSIEKGNFPPFNPPSLKFDWTLLDMIGEMFASSAIIGDIDNDDTCEIILSASRSGYLYVLKDSIERIMGDTLEDSLRIDTLKDHPKVVWSYKVNGWLTSSPLLFDINNDSYPEIIFGSRNKSVYALNSTGNLLWFFSTNGQISFSSPNVGDIGKNGQPKVIIGSDDSGLYVIDGITGSLDWSYQTGGAVVSSPAIGDINGDGYDEIIVGSKDHKLYAFNYVGDTLWTFMAGGEIRSSPAIGILDTSDILSDIVFGCYDSYVYALKGTDRSLLWKYKTDAFIDYQSTGLADIDKDGKIEVIATSFGGSSISALEGETGVEKWKLKDFSAAVPSSPTIADINNDGDLEIMTSVHDGYCYAWNPDGNNQWNWGYAGGDQDGPITVGDVDCDSMLEIIGSDIVFGKIFVLGFPVPKLDTVKLGGGIEENVEYKIRNSELKISKNPFFKSTILHYTIPPNNEYTITLLTLCDVSGRIIKTLVNENKQAGNYSVTLSAENLPPGIYFAKLSTPALKKDICKKLILVR